MKIICCLNEKGGVGKTTLCAYLIWHFLGAGERVLAIDLDAQANLSHTIGDSLAGVSAAELFVPDTRIEPAGPLTVIKSSDDVVDVEQTRDDTVPLAFRDNIAAAAGDFDLCVIDTPPSLGVRVIAALLASDFTVAPIDLGEYAITGIPKVLDFQSKVAEHYDTRAPEFLGIIISRYDRHSPRERELFAQIRQEEGLPLFPHHITKRDAYARSTTERVPAWQMSGTASREAAAEIRVVMEEFARRLDIRG
jgi:chromosome partitioning protein